VLAWGQNLDNAATLVQFRNGTMASFHTSRNAKHGYHIETEIYGTEGSIRVGNIPAKNLVTLFDDKGVRKECSSWFLERFEQAYLNEIQEFVNCIQQGGKSSVGAFDGKKATEMAYAARKSFDNKNVVFLDDKS